MRPPEWKGQRPEGVEMRPLEWNGFGAPLQNGICQRPVGVGTPTETGMSQSLMGSGVLPLRGTWVRSLEGGHPQINGGWSPGGCGTVAGSVMGDREVK